MQVENHSISSLETKANAFEKQQKLLTQVSCVFALIICTYTSIIFFVMPGFTPGKAVALVACGALGMIGWLSRFKRCYRACAIGLVTVTVLAGFGASLSNGGVEGYVAPILVTAPIAAALFLGARAATYSAIAVVAAFAMLALMGAHGMVKPTPYSPDATAIAAFILITTATLICAAGLGYFAHESESRIVSLTQAQDDLVALASELEYSAHHDSLTGISNRSRFSAHLQEMIDQAETPDERICIIHIDLDKFKAINDTHGHPVGDGVLRKAAHIMVDASEPDDLVARIGGDEFVIARAPKPLETPESIQAFCEQMILDLSRPMSVNGVECEIGASIGFVISDRACGSVEALIKNADLALYDAKNAGRGVARQFTARMRDKIEDQRRFLQDLEQSFAEDRIYCELQPQISFMTGKLRGIEALGRIRSRTGQVLRPGDFLEPLEDANLLAKFDHFVICKAMRALVAIRAAGHQVPAVSVNASASSLRSPGFVDLITAELERHALCNSDVVVEVLESILIEDSNDIAAKSIARLHAMGIRTVMDDFGSGHASMSSLLQLDLDGIKIDRSLVRDIEDERSQQIVQATLSLSKGMAMPPIFEGIETPRQFAILREMGCEVGQGYGICRPVEQAALIDWLNTYGQSEVVKLHERLELAQAS